MASIGVDFIVASLGGANGKGNIIFLHFSSQEAMISKAVRILMLISGLSERHPTKSMRRI